VQLSCSPLRVTKKYIKAKVQRVQRTVIYFVYLGMDISLLVPPPPWIRVPSSDGDYFLNDETGEETFENPYLRFLSLSERLTQTSGKQSDNYLGINEDENESHSFVQFRCAWQEPLYSGNLKSFGVLIRYFDIDKHVEIKFDGIEGEWTYSYLEGDYGPVDRFDLYLGARVKLFGRSLSITSASPQVIEWIDNEAKIMENKRAWLQEKIESLGAVPVVRRKPPQIVRNILRGVITGGRANLRALRSDIFKLEDQMVNLGLQHLLIYF